MIDHEKAVGGVREVLEAEIVQWRHLVNNKHLINTLKRSTVHFKNTLTTLIPYVMIKL